MNKTEEIALRVGGAYEALSNLDDCARMDLGVDAMGPRKVLEQFIADVEKLASIPAPVIASEPDYCHSDFELAKMIMSDCGISTINNENLTSRIADRIAKTRTNTVVASKQKPVKLQRPVFKCIDCGFIQFGHENCPHSGGHQMLPIDLFTTLPNTTDIEQRVAENFVSKFKRHVGGDGEFWLHELECFCEEGKWREHL